MSEGGDQVTRMNPLAGVAFRLVMAPGLPIGVIGALGSEGRDVPAELVAVTVKVYEVPFVSPVIVQVRAPVVEHVCPLGVAVAV
jgi:hypothetical protein